MGRPGLTLATAATAAVGLWFGIWLMAAVALAVLVRFGSRDRSGLFADVIALVGLFGQADPLWVALLIVASMAAREPDPRTRVVLLLAALAAVFVYVDWTILTGLLALIAMLRAAVVLRRMLRPAGYQR